VAFGEALQPSFIDYQKQVVANARALAETLLSRDLTITSGGTDNHLMLVDLRSRELTGRDVSDRLESAGITCNKNGVPFDDKSPFVTSGIRLGSPALTTRGLKEDDFRTIGRLIADVIDSMEDESTIENVRGRVRELCQSYPADGLRLV
jgi:glycine hydroxymethyltransferase